ncbi:putative acyl-CoA synthetase YngI [Dermatophagoides pteronyssinus]|uniref:putative acyl-CoA synthetase YngI n=1 Tax=Dermatophagoides pteronyssinus TaxID=6956 RepID=UPI003F67DE92
MSMKILKLNRLFRFYGQQNAKLLATTFPTAEYIINGNSKRNVTTDLFTSEFLPPYVNLPYSYAFGRSLNHILYKTVGNCFDDRLKIENGQPVIISHHENIQKTFSEFYQDVNRLAKAMYEHIGIKRGDVVGLWSCNTYDWIVIQYACFRIGAVLCTVNPFYQTYELDYAIRRGKMKALFMPGHKSQQDIVNRFSSIMMKTLNMEEKKDDDKIPFLLENIVTMDGDTFNDLNSSVKNNRNIRVLELEKLKQQTGELDSSITNLVLPDDPAVIMFTSGTTGRPKGACLSHFNIVNNSKMCAYRAGVKENSIFCVPLPFFHAFAGILGNLIPIATETGRLLIPCLKYDVRQLAQSITEHNATHLLATPTLVIDLLNYLRDNQLQVPTLCEVLAGGASMPIEVAYQFMEFAPNCKVRVAYGATETSPCATTYSINSTVEESIETVGSPLDFVEIKLVNPKTRQIVKIGETGELHCRGHVIMSGYWSEPEKTKESIDEAHWYNTGDLAVMTEKGLIKIIGRTKELIIVGGENVYPREIEEILYTHPAVETVNVIGVPDQRKGEEICAWVQLHKNVQATEDELREFCKERLTYFKVPRYFLFVDSYPMTPTGKAQKFIMQKMTIEKLNLQTK